MQPKASRPQTMLDPVCQNGAQSFLFSYIAFHALNGPEFSYGYIDVWSLQILLFTFLSFYLILLILLFLFGYIGHTMWH